MASLYKIAEISKQGFHQWLEREYRRREEESTLELLVKEIRKNHPRMGCREIYLELQPQYMGRDRFESFCETKGFKLIKKRKFKPTTDSRGVPWVPNLLLDLDEITKLNQVWVSDITYFELNGRFLFMTFIMDLFSRVIVGHSLSRSLSAESTTLPALRMAVDSRKIKQQDQLILHSDGGGQYFSKKMKKLQADYGIRVSRAQSVYENPHAERVNGTIKNDYLIPWQADNEQLLRQQLTKAVVLYNTCRKHKSLDRCIPTEFEQQHKTGLLTNRWVINKRKKEAKKEKVNISIQLK